MKHPSTRASTSSRSFRYSLHDAHDRSMGSCSGRSAARAAVIQNAAIGLISPGETFSAATRGGVRLLGSPGRAKDCAKQNPDGSWRYPGGKPHVRSRENTTNSRLSPSWKNSSRSSASTEKFGDRARAKFSSRSRLTRRPSRHLWQSVRYNLRWRDHGVAGQGWSPTTHASQGFLWLLATRQSDGGWRSRGQWAFLFDIVDLQRHPKRSP